MKKTLFKKIAVSMMVALLGTISFQAMAANAGSIAIQTKKTFTIGGNQLDSLGSIDSVGTGYVVVGAGTSTDDVFKGNHGVYDAIIARYDSSHKRIWSKIFGGGQIEYFTKVITVADGFVCIGFASSNDGDLVGLGKGKRDGLIVKYSLDGNMLWKHTYGGRENDIFVDVVADGSGYAAVGNTQYPSGGDLANFNEDVTSFLVKYDSKGNVLKSVGFNDNQTGIWSGGNALTSISKAGTGYVITGIDETLNGNDRFNMKLVLLDNNGNVLKRKVIAGSGYEITSKVISTADGYVIVGETDSSNDGDFTGIVTKGKRDGVIAKLTKNLDISWLKTFGGSEYDRFSSVIATNDGYIVSGASNSNDGDLSGFTSGLYSKALTIKYDFNGNVKQCDADYSTVQFEGKLINNEFVSVGSVDTNVRPEKRIEGYIQVKKRLASNEQVNITVGSSLRLDTSVLPLGASALNPTWKSSSTTIATITPAGLVKALKKGTCTITVTSADKKATAKITLLVK